MGTIGCLDGPARRHSPNLGSTVQDDLQRNLIMNTYIELCIYQNVIPLGFSDNL